MYKSENVKIVHIETHFVETDPSNFRALVQSLTGKNSSPADWARNGLSSSSSSSSLSSLATMEEAETDGAVEPKAKAKTNHYYYDRDAVAAVRPGEDEEMMMNDNQGDIKYENEDYVLSFMKVNNLSFKDFDILMSEFPLVEEFPLL